MKIIKFTLFLLGIVSLTSCASGYKMIEPKSINYISKNENDDVKLEYKYDLLKKKYAKKEDKKGIKLVAVKITNNSDRDLMLGRDLNLVYENGRTIHILEDEKVFKALKQSPASHLFYLLLTPVTFNTTDSNGYTTISFPIGVIIGPGLAGGNMIAAGSANKKFKHEIQEYNIYGSVIKKGETKYGLIGIQADTYDALKLSVQ